LKRKQLIFSVQTTLFVKQIFEDL